MQKFWMNKLRNSQVIKVNPNTKKEIYNIEGRGHHGMNKIHEEALEREFEPCTEDHFEYYKNKGIKDVRTSY